MIIVVTFCQGEMSRLILQLKFSSLSRGRIALKDQAMGTRKWEGAITFYVDVPFSQYGGFLLLIYYIRVLFCYIFHLMLCLFLHVGVGAIHPYGGPFFNLTPSPITKISARDHTYISSAGRKTKHLGKNN